MAFDRRKAQDKRHARVRAKISGTTERPRLTIRKSLRHLYAQVVDDKAGVTLCQVTTNKKSNKSEAKHFSNKEWATKLGGEVAELAKSKGVEAVIFDRGGARYHGVVKAFGDAAREAGLKF